MTVAHPAGDRRTLLAEFAARYVWWSEDGGPSDDLIVAQVMNLGTYDDIRQLESVASPAELREVMVRAKAGWISARSWSFWRGRLQAAGCEPLPQSPPRRPFHADVL